MYIVIETPTFLDSAAPIWSDDERADFVAWIAVNPEAGDVMPGMRGLRKVRFGRSGMGKRGGARAIYYVKNQEGQIVLVIAYAKAKFDNLRPEFLLKLKARYDV